MVYIRRTISVFVLILLCFSLYSCTEAAPESSTASDFESTLIEESRLADTKKVIITIYKNEYSMDERIKFEFRAENAGEGFTFSQQGPDAAFVQYWDGEVWKKCEKEFGILEYAIEGRCNIYSTSFLLSDRADEGKEKYRLGMDFTCGTFYSEEFTIK